MKFATLRNAQIDGQLLLVSRDMQQAVSAQAIAPTLLNALQHWDTVYEPLQALYAALNAGTAPSAFAFDPAACTAPLPRSPQWLDGSAFLNHSNLMDRAFNKPAPPLVETVPMMYQGASDDFLGPHDDVFLPREEDGIDFEGEFGVITAAVPMGVDAASALDCVRLVVQINDWSLRALGPHEMKTGFGFVQAKPSTAFAPLAVTPDELGAAWHGGRVQMPLQVQWNGDHFGQPHGGEMNFHFGQLIAHAAHTRRLTAGCIVGSGTVSNAARTAGSACIAERRVIEIIDHGQSSTPFMRFGDRVRMQALWDDGSPGPFGVIEQRVAKYCP
ncbi:fumarylacetoacetate hydrolase family protein [Curvibacter sp. CHRR-16]|uniref:fumarylacetoacetate hydrolase family protein n=1 Tax=Curvibacter sp. CHRR-16 TaxID=2835872 RepID=UPI001BD99C75|nr:fumarylacetoacetate hydrolase family protein [Curvibacter sp. CHRR-16]MBT0569734.1 fumarylacetoacetate hydrolase family protein [Curvibacter sp. CHRR-16]